MSIADISAESMVWADKIQAHHPAWLFVTLFALLGFYAWIRIDYGSILMGTIQASFSFQVATRMFKDNSVLQKQLDNVLNIFYLLSTSLILYVGEIHFGFEPYGVTGASLFFLNLAFLLLLFLARVVVINTAGFLFNRIRIYQEYLYNMFIFNKLIGLSILPLLLFVLYTDGILQEIFLWMGMAAILAILIMRLIRGVFFSFKKDVSIFYMFLYLCALEIAPLALLYRWLEGIL
jgi:hypothetical protein